MLHNKIVKVFCDVTFDLHLTFLKKDLLERIYHGNLYSPGGK